MILDKIAPLHAPLLTAEATNDPKNNAPVIRKILPSGKRNSEL